MRRIWGVAVSVTALAGIAGCGSSSGGGTAAQAVSSQSTSSAQTSVQMSKLAVSAQQLGAGWTSQTMTAGDEVQGQVTMDLCGAEFPSESLRTARHQVILSSTSGERFSNEVVLYRPGGAQQARTELLKAIATCPSGPVEGTVKGEGMLIFKINTLPSDGHWLPGTVAVHGVVTDATGQSEDEVLIYQFRGDAMSAIYGATTDGRPDPAELRAAADAAALLQAWSPAAS